MRFEVNKVWYDHLYVGANFYKRTTVGSLGIAYEYKTWIRKMWE